MTKTFNTNIDSFVCARRSQRMAADVNKWDTTILFYPMRLPPLLLPNPSNTWVRERGKFIDIISNVRTMKCYRTGHINRLTDDRLTSRVNTWRPYDMKIRRARPAKRWRDDLDIYWQSTVQVRLTLSRHDEAFAQRRDTTVASWSSSSFAYHRIIILLIQVVRAMLWSVAQI